MQVIPRVVHNFRSKAEQKVFDALCATDLGPNAFALHSLNLARHEYKRWSELDFVVAWEEGVYALEVKGGRVAISEGIWTFTNRFDETYRKSEGPFDQAKSGHDALRTALSGQAAGFNLGNICWGWGVVFPDIDFDHASVSWSPELIADHWVLSGSGGLGQYLRNLARWWRARGRGHHSLADAADLSALRRAMRPDFDKVPTIAVSIDQAIESVVRLTQEQLEILDSIDENERLICIGGAGTGKSFVAAEAARREASSGRKVVVLCRSPVFAAFLRGRVAQKSVVVTEFDAIAAMLGRGTQFDCAIIDEAQDLLTAECMEQVDGLLRCGLRGGRWRMFMDPNNQSGLHEPAQPEVLASLKQVAAIHKLSRNCRNTQQIVMQTQLVTGADIGTAVIEGQGPPIEFVDVGDERAEAVALGRRLSQWLEAGIRPGDITVLSPKALGDSVAAALPSGMSSQIVSVSAQVASKWPPRNITFSTIRDFKGLENRCIAVVDLKGFSGSDPELANLYVAMTRAHAGLWIAVPAAVRGNLDRLIVQNARHMLGKVRSA